MELVLYLMLVMLAIITSYEMNIKLPSRYTYGCLFIIFFIYSFLIRMFGYDIDIQTYVDTMKSLILTPYYLREPIVWLGQAYLYSLLKNELLVLLIYDFFAGVILCVIFKNYSLKFFSFISFLTFFPFILGFQNIYRQFYAEILFMLSLSLVEIKSYKKSWLFFILSVLSHNSAAVFLPILLVARKNSKFFKIYSLISLLIMPLVLVYARGTKSSDATGENAVLFYVLCMFLILLFFIYSCKFKIERKNLESLLVMIYLCVICLMSTIVLSSTSSERISIFSLMIIYPYLIRTIVQNFSKNSLLKNSLTVAGFFPVLAFGTSVLIL